VLNVTVERIDNRRRVRRYEFEASEDVTRRSLVRRAKAACGLTNVRADVDEQGDEQAASAGSRHWFLVGYASRLAREMEDRRELRHALWACNKCYCSPPKTDDEVYRIADDQFNLYRYRSAKRRAGGGGPLEHHRLRLTIRPRGVTQIVFVSCRGNREDVK
jgi:hypothetical protein